MLLYYLLYFTTLKRILRLLLFHGFVLLTFQLLLSYPLIKIWSPDCLLPVLGGCDGRLAGLGWAGLDWAAPLCVIQTSFLHLPWLSAVQ